MSSWSWCSSRLNTPASRSCLPLAAAATACSAFLAACSGVAASMALLAAWNAGLGLRGFDLFHTLHHLMSHVSVSLDSPRLRLDDGAGGDRPGPVAVDPAAPPKGGGARPRAPRRPGRRRRTAGP